MEDTNSKRQKLNNSFEKYIELIEQNISVENYQAAYDLMNELKELYDDDFNENAELLTEYGFCIQGLDIINDGYIYPEDEALIYYDKGHRQVN